MTIFSKKREGMYVFNFFTIYLLVCVYWRRSLPFYVILLCLSYCCVINLKQAELLRLLSNPSRGHMGYKGLLV